MEFVTAHRTGSGEVTNMARCGIRHKAALDSQDDYIYVI